MTAATAGFLYAAGLAPPVPNMSMELVLLTWLGLPSALAMIIGGYVPHIYRHANRAVAASRNATLKAMPAAPADPPRPASMALLPEHQERAAACAGQSRRLRRRIGGRDQAA